MKTKKYSKKTAKIESTSKSSAKKTLVVAKTEVIDLTSLATKKDVKVSYSTKYFTVTCFKSQLSNREVTIRSKEHLVQKMLLQKKTYAQIKVVFCKLFTKEEVAEKKSKSETAQQYLDRRFHKYFYQECNKIKKLSICKELQ